MKLLFHSPDGRLTVEAEPKSIKGAFQAITEIRTFLVTEPCGICKSKATYPNLKTPKGYKYYEWVCADCGAVFQFGQKQESEELFPKRRDENGPLPNGGWSKYQAGQQGGQAPHNGSGHSQAPFREPQDYSQESEVPF